MTVAGPSSMHHRGIYSAALKTILPQHMAVAQYMNSIFRVSMAFPRLLPVTDT